MEKVTIKTQAVKHVEEETPAFKTKDGKVFTNKKIANEHEKILEKFPKLSEFDIEWIEEYSGQEEEYGSDFFKSIESNDLLILCDHSGGSDLFFITIEPILSAVKAVIKALHRKTIGCNYNVYVHGLIYKKESLCFDDGKKRESSGYYETGSGRNIKNVLK